MKGAARQDMFRVFDLCIVGGGVAGLHAAAVASRNGLDCVLLEKMEKTGRKMRISGKGRCNFTNVRGREDFMEHVVHGRKLLEKAYDAFPSRAAIEYMQSLGVGMTEERGGRVFPESGKAWDVAQAMVDDARKNGAVVLTGQRVCSVQKAEDGNFRTETGQGRQFVSRNVLIATGGASYPSTGSTGDGYGFAWKLGHSIVPLRPALTHLVCAEMMDPVLLKNVDVSLRVDGVTVSSEFGEAEFNDRGIAGASVLSQSHIAVDAILDGKSVAVVIDLKPSRTAGQLVDRIAREKDAGSANGLLRSLVPRQLVGKIARECRLDLSKPFPDSKAEQLVSVLKALEFRITDYGDFMYAITTAGGVSADEIDPLTMQSRLCGGLYFAGEVADIDADTGGYNIQSALCTSFLAVRSIVENAFEK